MFYIALRTGMCRELIPTRYNFVWPVGKVTLSVSASPRWTKNSQTDAATCWWAPPANHSVGISCTRSRSPNTFLTTDFGINRYIYNEIISYPHFYTPDFWVWEQQCETVEGGCRPFGELGVQVGRLFLVSNRPQDRGSDRCTVSPGPGMREYTHDHTPLDFSSPPETSLWGGPLLKAQLNITLPLSGWS